MKKVLAIILAALVIVSLTACSKQQSNTGTDQGNSSQADSSSKTIGSDDEYPITGNIVYFKDTLGWGENNHPIYVHYWNSSGELVKWPGSQMKSLGNNIYSYELPDKVEFIIFNMHGDGMSKAGQTRDIPYDGSIRKFQASSKQDEMQASYATDWDGNEIKTNTIDDGSGYNQLIVNVDKLATIESNDKFDVYFSKYSLTDENGNAKFSFTIKNNTDNTLSSVSFFVLAYNPDKHARIIDVGPAVDVGLGDDAYIQEYTSEGDLALKPGDTKDIKLNAEKKTISDFKAIVSSYTPSGGKEVLNSTAFSWYKNAYTNKVVNNSSIYTKFSSNFDKGDVEGVSQDDRGAVTLDATVLFDVDSSALSDKGKANLKKVIDAYVKSVSAADGTILIDKITVEGHTDPDGTHEHNQKLSEDRANAVRDYCVELHPELEDIMVIKGCADDNPVKNDDGSVDKTASRRVCFVAE